MPGEISFERLIPADLPLLHRWLNNAEVALFYGVGDDNRKNPTMDEVIKEYEENFVPEPKNQAFVIHLDGRPVGYIQCYRLGDYPDYAKELGGGPGSLGDRHPHRRKRSRARHWVARHRSPGGGADFLGASRHDLLYLSRSRERACETSVREGGLPLREDGVAGVGEGL
ncbi:MAG: GNAT family N-acetyltransferase [Chloroflexi bacterium]|nr:GNAT family N-acetyltransferase [Chloroflexota bacterium]